MVGNHRVGSIPTPGTNRIAGLTRMSLAEGAVLAADETDSQLSWTNMRMSAAGHEYEGDDAHRFLSVVRAMSVAVNRR